MKDRKEEIVGDLLGLLVKSKAGRDEGHYFIVVKVVCSQYVMIADGDYRPLAKPKKKKLKHLSLQEVRFSSISEKIATGKKVFDSEVFSAIKKAVAEINAQKTDN